MDARITGLHADQPLQIILLDSNGKKTRFLQEARRVLGLSNVEVVHMRAEDYLPETGFDTVTSRAFSDLAQMISLTRHLLNPQGQWLAMKGRYPEEELNGIHYPWQVMPCQVPGSDAERCCVIIHNRP